MENRINSVFNQQGNGWKSPQNQGETSWKYGQILNNTEKQQLVSKWCPMVYHAYPTYITQFSSPAYETLSMASFHFCSMYRLWHPFPIVATRYSTSKDEHKTSVHRTKLSVNIIITKRPNFFKRTPRINAWHT